MDGGRECLCGIDDRDIHVTVNLCNQGIREGIREIPKWAREFANSLKSLGNS